MTIDKMKSALEACQRLFNEALPKFNWGASFLDANAIQLLNEVPLTVQAALTPPPEDPNLGKFCWWFDDDERYHMADSEAEAHGEAAQRIDEDAEPGESREYWVARVAHPVDVIDGDTTALRLGENVLEQVDEWAGEETGAEDWTMDLTNEDKQDLGRMILTYLRQNAKAQWYGVAKGTKVKHSYTAGSE